MESPRFASLGCELRRFRAITYSAFSTMELPKEAAAGGGKPTGQAKTAMKVPTLPQPSTTAVESAKTSPAEANPDLLALPKVKKRKTFNLSAYKVCALGDYVRTISMFETTYSYSTQTVCTTLSPNRYECSLVLQR
jgi:hypothetical protein